MNPRTRIYIGVFVIFTLGVAYLLNRIIQDLEPRYRESVEEPLVDIARILAATVASDVHDGHIDVTRFRTSFTDLYERHFVAHIYDLQKTAVDLRVYITDRRGIVLFDSSHSAEGEDYSRWNDVRLTLQGRYGARTSRNIKDDPKSSVLYVGAPITWQDQILGVLTVCKPTVNMKLFIDTARRQIVLAGIATVFALLVLALLTSIWLVRPYGLIADYVRLLKQSRRTPLPHLWHRALKMLRNAIIDMREALAGRSYVEEYVQTLTHEIKSPLSAIRGAAELLQEDMPVTQRTQFVHNIANEATRIQEIVDRLLQLASLEKRRGLAETELMDAEQLLIDIVHEMTPTLKLRELHINTRLQSGLQIVGERFLLHRAISNLLQNASDFAPRGSTIDLHLRSERKSAVIQILDRGPGIPDYARDKVMQRFYSLPRPDTGKKGTGLGLAFVKEVTELHQGSINVGNHRVGGVIATMYLPLQVRQGF